jgi:hypothetical protein
MSYDRDCTELPDRDLIPETEQRNSGTAEQAMARASR